MKSSNPVLGRLSAAAHQPTYQVPGGPAGYGYGGQPGYGYPEVIQSGRQDVMTIDDVVVKTVSLLGAAVVAAAITWVLVPVQSIGPVWIASMLIGLVLGLVISFAQITNPVILFAYALVEGVFLGAVSKAYEARWNGIVLLAVIATLSVFFVMAAL